MLNTSAIVAVNIFSNELEDISLGNKTSHMKYFRMPVLVCTKYVPTDRWNIFNKHFYCERCDKQQEIVYILFGIHFSSSTCKNNEIRCLSNDSSFCSGDTSNIVSYSYGLHMEAETKWRPFEDDFSNVFSWMKMSLFLY